MSTNFIVAVSAVIFRDGKVLGMRRAADKDAGAGLWETPSGRVEAGEQPLDAVRREAREETGLALRFDPRPIDALQTRRGEAPMVVVYYRAEWVGGEVVQSAEHDMHAWMTPDEFAARTTLGALAAVVRRAAGEDHAAD